MSNPIVTNTTSTVSTTDVARTTMTTGVTTSCPATLAIGLQAGTSPADCTSLVGRTETISQNKLDFVSFTEAPTCAFANAYPCTIEFGGQYYQNATTCFLAQQYTDQPHIMELLTRCETVEEALFLSSTCPMTDERKLSWENPDAQHVNKYDVMMHVQRAKFGQNSNLKDQLLSTENLYIACQGYDPLWIDGFNGTGQNQLGQCLMQLRKEYGGDSIVPQSTDYTLRIQALDERCILIMTGIPGDIIGQIFLQCFSNNDITGIQALSCTNKHFYTNITMIAEKLDLAQLCPLLKIVSAEEAQKYGFLAQPAPIFPKLKMIKAYQEMAPHIEDNAGVTYFDFTLPEELTLRQIVKIAEIQGIEVGIYWPLTSQNIGDVAIKQAFPCMLANNVFKDSRKKTYDEQCVLVRGHGCELPTVEQYIIQIVLIQKISNQFLCLFGKNPLTYGRSSTIVQGCPLYVGGSAPARLGVFIATGTTSSTASGVGGSRPFVLGTLVYEKIGFFWSWTCEGSKTG